MPPRRNVNSTQWRADQNEQFKSDVKSIRKKAEQDFVNALTSFHQEKISSSKN